ncbi:LANO_0G11034g1_1 [Lachancea nothofagi CBS 11611]|uniref:LANO_0G11034g1_1 n=1 Tax=Lachancea nothofagi CBS 11611 TaxID=1266666 RepID=A0A1G4KJ37_9SACH|nr:LANO_0G11034g1_1 [Lachancea nothofagi CBS 11611]
MVNRHAASSDISSGDKELFCAVMNPLTGNYIDLSQLSTTPNNLHKVDHNRDRKDWEKTRWMVRSREVNLNFTLGICSSPTTDEDSVSNSTGAYYVDPDQHQEVSIGDFATTPRFMGKKLTLAYENGDMCPNGVDRRASILNFVCDKEISTKAQINFVGSLHNCSYFFEVKSIYACPTSHKSNDVNVLGIFFGIFLVFFLVEWGRRWFYGRVRARLRYNNESTVIDARPHWETIERPSSWRRVFKNVFRFGAPAKNAGIKLSTSPQYRNPSTDSLVRDIEAQNRLLDNLDATSASS